MKKIVLTAILATAFVAANIIPSQAQSPEQLYQKGLIKEEGEGSLQEAIVLFNKVADNSEADQSLRAKALLHTGMCYEKMGKQEAVKAYQRLVSSFPAQKSEVSVARERLSRLVKLSEVESEAQLIPKFTKIKIPTKIGWSVRLSPDGKILGLVSDEKIWKLPLSGNIGPDFPGAPVLLNTDGIPVEYTDLSWSTDGKWIAFNDPGMTGPNQRIYIVPSEGGKPEKIIENFRDARVVNYRISLSPNGENLAFSSVEEKKQHIFTILTKGGNPVRLTDMQAREPAFSPDGKMIAYVEDKDLGAGQGGLGLWIIPATGGTPKLLAEAGTASSPVWSPNGNFIAFLDFSQAELFYGKQINIVPVLEGGKTPGKVTRIDVPNDIGDVRKLAGWTPENKIGALCRTKQEFALYTLPAKGGQASIILPDCYTLQPRYSRNGKQIYYTTPPVEGDNKFYKLMLASVPATGGTGTPLSKDEKGKNVHSLSYQGGNRVSPDGNWIVSAAWSSADTSSKIHFPRARIWKIAVDGSKSIQVTKTQGQYADLCPSWSPDGKKIAFKRTIINEGMDSFESEYGIFIIDSSGGEPELLTSVNDKYIYSPVWSPDGTMIAYLTGEPPTSRSNPTLNVVNVSTGESRVIGKIPDVNVNLELAWSPDSKRIAFNGDNLIKIINVDSGKIEDVKTNLVDVDIWHLDWSPDGEQFVFSGMKGGKDEFWLMENFLPLEKLAQKKEKEDLSIRKALANTDVEPLGSPSPDGRYISFIDWNSGGNVGILNLETKERRLLTDFKDPNEQAYYSSWSPDGNQIAYCWWANDKDQYNLSIVEVKESKSRVLFISDTIGWIELGNWSSDGKYIAATLNINGKPESQIVRVSTVDGSIQTLKTYNKSYLGGKPYLSPDSRYVAYDLPDDKASGNSDIYILSLENEEVNNLTSHPSHDYILGWTPDGKNILFASDRSGTVDAMIIKVEDGKAKDQPGSVKQNIGPIVPMGLTKNGSFYFGQWPGADNVYTTEINFDEGKLVTKPELLIQRFEGRNYLPDYSSDGKNIAYISERGILSKGKHGLVLCIHDLATGEEVEINTDPEIARAIRDLHWSPDDHSITLTCFNQEGYSRIYNYDLKSGKLTALVTESNDDPSGTNYGSSVWSKDGQSIYYTKMSRYSTTSSIMARNTLTGIDRELVRYTSDDLMDRFFNISISPDGKWLAAINRGENRVVRLISTESGETRDLYTFVSSGGQPYSQVWSRDGKYIIFPYPKQGTGIREWNLMRIPVEGGENLSIETNILRIDSPTLHPDGRTLLFSGPGYSYPENNIWEMKNFLPE